MEKILKKMKLLLLAMTAAIIFCACDNNSLEYVENDAEWIIYANSSQIFQNKIWSIVEQNDQFREQKEEFEKSTSLTLGDLDGNVTFWGIFESSKDYDPQLKGAVLVLNKHTAGTVFEQIKVSIEKEISQTTGQNTRRSLDRVTIDDCSAIVLKKQTMDHSISDWSKPDVIMTCVMIDSQTLHFYWMTEPQDLWEKRLRNPLAKQIEQDVIAAGAIDGEAIRTGLRFGAGIKEVPRTGDVILQIKSDDKKFIIEGSIDISDIIEN